MAGRAEHVVYRKVGRLQPVDGLVAFMIEVRREVVWTSRRPFRINDDLMRLRLFPPGMGPTNNGVSISPRSLCSSEQKGRFRCQDCSSS